MSSRDRFGELEQFPGRPEDGAGDTRGDTDIAIGEDEIDSFFKQIDDIREHINTISAKVEDTKKKYQTINAATSIEEEDRVKAELEDQQLEIKKLANKVRTRLKSIQTKIEADEQEQRQNQENGKL